MNTNTYNVNPTYTGARNICVPTRMYSKNKMMAALHMKSKRVLCVNMDTAMLTYHCSKDAKDRDVKDEIPFSRIKSIDADVSSASKGKYYLTVITDECDLKFKFKDARDFHSVVDALRNTLHNDKPVYTASQGYNTLAQDYNANPNTYNTNKNLNDSISSDDAHEYELHNRDRDAVKGIKKADKDMNRDNYDVNRNVIDNTTDINKDALKNEYKAEKQNLDNQYDAQKDYIKQTGQGHDAKSALKDDYKAAKSGLNNEYDAQKDNIKHSENLAHDVNKATYDANKHNIEARY